jgi:hypothetical protein
MCDPVSLTVTGVVLAAAAGGVTAYGQYQSGKAQSKYYNYLAEQNEIEAQAAEKTAEQQSTIAQNEAAQKAKELKGDVSRVKGAQKAAMAAMGIYGVTADDILTDTTNRAKLDAANIRYNADVASWAANKEGSEKAWALRNQAKLYRYSGKNAMTAAKLNMTSTLLGTASSIASIGALSGFGGGKLAIPGQGGYGLDTPPGVRDMGTWSKWSPSKLY